MNDPREVPQQVLAGIRVVEVATYIFGPAAATIMSDFGAEVIKVEPLGTGDPYRFLARLPPLPSAGPNYCWILDGRNKQSIAADLKSPAGREIVLQLLAEADVFLTNYHPSVLAQLKLREEDLRPLRPRLIYAHATGYGLEGDDVEQPGYDVTAYWARSGLMEGVAASSAEPCLSLAGMGDHPSAMTMFGAIMLGLLRLERTGQGSYVTTSLMANGAWANSCMLQAALCGAEPYVRQSRHAAFNAMVNHYLTRDGKRFILCCLKPEQDWPRLCQAVDMPELRDDPRFATSAARQTNACELIALLDAAFAQRDLAEWKCILGRHGVVFSPVPSAWEVVDDPQMAANGVFVSVDDAEHGRLRTVNSPMEIRDVPKTHPHAAPQLGQHTRDILRDRLGYSEAAIQDLIDRKVVQDRTLERR